MADFDTVPQSREFHKLMEYMRELDLEWVDKCWRTTMRTCNRHDKRFYCPRCGEVHCGMKRHGQWLVVPHYSADKEGLMTGRGSMFQGPACRGGYVDYEKDRAP